MEEVKKTKGKTVKEEELDTSILEDVDHGENKVIDEKEIIVEEREEESDTSAETESPNEKVLTDDDKLVLEVRGLFENMLDKKMEAQYCEAAIIKDILEIMDSKRARAIKNFNIAKNKFNDIRSEVPQEIFNEAVKIDTLKYYLPTSHPEFSKSALGKQIFKMLRTYLRSFEIEDVGFSARIEE